MRLLSLISNGRPLPESKQYAGLPPELAGGVETRQKLGSAAFLVIEVTTEGTFLYRYGILGECVGDTWHANVDDAKHQASYEYGGLVEEWINLPTEVTDVVAVGLSRSLERT